MGVLPELRGSPDKVKACFHCFELVFSTGNYQTDPAHDYLQTSQNLVYIQPCNSHALYLLGSSQFNKYENSSPGETATKLRHEARTSFEVSTELQGKPAEGEVPELVAGGFSTSVVLSPLYFKNNTKYKIVVH